MTNRVFGEIEGVPPGTVFGTRKEVSEAGLHGPWQSGIHGTAAEGASSVVASGGYADDEFLEGVLIYTGHGGRDPGSGKQIRDQSLEDSGNAALVTSSLESLPVRVIRGQSGGPYVYEGLHRVASYWSQKGIDGFEVWKFRLEPAYTLAKQLSAGLHAEPPEGKTSPERERLITQRIVRSGQVIEFVKKVHDNKCQVCGTVLSHPGGRTSEGAHVRPLGAPHEGSDTTENVLCLCPNHHTLFDRGGIWISEDWWVYDMDNKMVGELRIRDQHTLEPANFEYHRGLWRH
ncbi:HNH endonuclease [Pontimonas sp.]|jgi:putative restriction endonuclease|nr:YDG/SRA domain-containing protein [Pontimonas sp.]MDA8901139.1 HNH endonuclease [Pontimonas sp.]